ncbi:ATP-binding cassette domain-containing protein [Lactococcus raffinolactis]|uniref:ATP-binding cassette domain-containing protein n=1 Tax=Pseudolactococcus raffinolactis TaxID=1366 RepID=A0AAE6YNX5_9LACT|nr:ABC transporter ATP-binding protein [Lactococcus raffinolactis]QIW58928.1 ATP-binding cassette domain-containing protein [Lactococcus raffinolactis]
MADKTSKIEATIQTTTDSKLSYLWKMWLYIFSSTKKISLIYLGLFISISLLRPLVALIWKAFISETQSLNNSFFSAIGFISVYWGINFVISLVDTYLAFSADGDLEQLEMVQSNRQQEMLHAKLYSRVGDLPSEYFEMASVNDNIRQVFDFIGNPFSGVNHEVMLKSYIVIARTVSILSIALTLFVFNPWLCLILLVAPLPVLWTTGLSEKFRFKLRRENSQLARRVAYYQDLFLSSASKEIKVLGLHHYFFEAWQRVAEAHILKEKKLIRIQTLLDTCNSLIVNLVTIGNMVFIVVLLAKGQISLGIFGAVLALTGGLVTDTTQLLTCFATLMGKQQEAQQFFDFMSLPSQDNKGQTLSKVSELRLENVSYRYPLTSKYVLKKINLKIKSGENIAFVGENGGGKTTLVKLILGLLSPSMGEFTINGIESGSLNISNRLAQQSTVSQELSRYKTFTIKKNVYLGDTLNPLDETKIDQALDFVSLNDIASDEVLGKEIGGIDLSGGQWQKLAIARSVYRNRALLVLDEPTSNLDPLMETEIFQHYLTMANDKTVIYVTHRISMAALAQRIIVIKDGEIIQDGSHDDLIKNEGEYKRLYQEQAKWYVR